MILSFIAADNSESLFGDKGADPNNLTPSFAMFRIVGERFCTTVPA